MGRIASVRCLYSFHPGYLVIIHSADSHLSILFSFVMIRVANTVDHTYTKITQGSQCYITPLPWAYIRKESVGGIDEHFSQIVGTSDVLVHPISNEPFLELKCEILLGIYLLLQIQQYLRSSWSPLQQCATEHTNTSQGSTEPLCSQLQSNTARPNREAGWVQLVQIDTHSIHAATLEPIVQSFSNAMSGITPLFSTQIKP